MALESYRQTEMTSMILERLNLFFIVVFSAECFLKLFALRLHYFKEPWNVFDFVVVILSIAGEYSTRHFDTFTMTLSLSPPIQVSC